jgi:hypothetical protein
LATSKLQGVFLIAPCRVSVKDLLQTFFGRVPCFRVDGEHWKQPIHAIGDMFNYILKPFRMGPLELVHGQGPAVYWSYVHHKQSDHANSPNIHFGRLNHILKDLRRNEFRASG